MWPLALCTPWPLDFQIQKRIVSAETIWGNTVSTNPITAMGCRQCLPLSVVQLKGKHCWKPHFWNGVVDMFHKTKVLLFFFICLWPRVLFISYGPTRKGCHGSYSYFFKKTVILESLSQTFRKPKMFPLHRWCLQDFFLTLFSGIQIALWRNGQKQTKFRSTIDKALECTYQISTC